MLFRVDGDHLPMQAMAGTCLADQLRCRLHRFRQPSQPGQPMPERAVGQGRPPMSHGILLPIVVHQPLLLVLDRLPIGLLTTQKISRHLQQRGAHKLLVAQGKREGSR